MSSPQPASAPNRPRRRSSETRRRVEEAAAELFRTSGYAATTMQAIADAAGVHVQTIYLAYGTKAAVLAASVTRLVAGDEDPETHPSERGWVREIQDAADPREKIRLYVDHILGVSDRLTAMIDVLRSTAPSEPDVAAFLERMELGRREGPLHLLGPLAADGRLRAGLTPDTVADAVFALVSPDAIRALIDRCGWSRERTAEWLTGLVSEMLLGQPRSGA